MLTLWDLITSSGKYPERAKSTELTEEKKKNGERFLSKLNPFLKELGIEKPKFSSGFRTSGVNSSIKNAAKKSLHMECMAGDLEDPDDLIDKAIKKNPELLDKYELWLENPVSTPGWAHLDIGIRSKRPIRIFSV